MLPVARFLLSATLLTLISLQALAERPTQNPLRNLYFGEMYAALNPGTPGHDNSIIQQLIKLTDPDEHRRWFMKYVISNGRSAPPKRTDFYPGEDVVKSGWKSVIAAAQ